MIQVRIFDILGNVCRIVACKSHREARRVAGRNALTEIVRPGKTTLRLWGRPMTSAAAAFE